MQPDRDIAQETIDQIRVNVAFEEMIVSVLTGAAIGGALAFGFNLFGLVSGGFIFAGLLSAMLDAFLVAFVVFLTGFGASVAIGAPLFMFLEKRKRRTVWPYLAAALGVAIFAMFFKNASLPDTEGWRGAVLVFTPAVIIALTFGRLMRPHWKAAEKAEADAAAGPIMVRIH